MRKSRGTKKSCKSRHNEKSMLISAISTTVKARKILLDRTDRWNGRDRFDEGKAAKILLKHVSRASNKKMTLTEQHARAAEEG